MAEGDGKWVRVNAKMFAFPTPALAADESEFPDAGDFGLHTALQNPSATTRLLDSLAIDIPSRHEVDVFDVRRLSDPGGWTAGDVVKIAETVFPEPHPDQWWRDVQETSGRIALLVGPLKRFLQPGDRISKDFLRHARMGMCCLVAHAYQSVTGLRP
jgi:hypothetical protein